MNIADEIIDKAAKELASDIDWQVLSDLLCKGGWTKVILKPMTWEDSYAIDEWVVHNIKGNFDTRGLVWIFKDPKDANWFSLRWLS